MKCPCKNCPVMPMCRQKVLNFSSEDDENFPVKLDNVSKFVFQASTDFYGDTCKLLTKFVGRITNKSSTISNKKIKTIADALQLDNPFQPPEKNK